METLTRPSAPRHPRQPLASPCRVPSLSEIALMTILRMGAGSNLPEVVLNDVMRNAVAKVGVIKALLSKDFEPSHIKHLVCVQKSLLQFTASMSDLFIDPTKLPAEYRHELVALRSFCNKDRCASIAEDVLQLPIAIEKAVAGVGAHLRERSMFKRLFAFYDELVSHFSYSVELMGRICDTIEDDPGRWASLTNSVGVATSGWSSEGGWSSKHIVYIFYEFHEFHEFHELHHVHNLVE